MTRAVPQPFVHAMMPLPDHDEHAREDFIVGLKLHMMEHAYPYDDLVYERCAKPKFIKAKGRAPKDCDEAHDLMMGDDFTKLWSGIARNMQEMLWANAGGIAARQLPRLEAEARKQTASPRGTLTLDPNFKMPNYVEAVDIHCMPGGYQTDLGEDDLYVAAMYERGAYYYTTGMSGRLRDGAGKALVDAIKRFFPDINPKHILDVGCTTGGSTIPIAEAWPEAEVHAIDRTEFLATAGFESNNIVESWAGRDGSGKFTFYDKPFDESFPNARGGIGRVQFFGARK